MNKVHFKIVAICIVLASLIFIGVSWFLSSVVPESSHPRNITILVGGDLSSQYTFIRLYENNLDVVVFQTWLTWDEELGEWGIQGREPFNMTLLKGFRESFHHQII